MPKADARVAVEVKPAKPEYQPGDGVDVQVDVTDPAAHGPIAGAEVTLYAVDKGVLSLTGYKTPEPLRTFYRPESARRDDTGLTIPNLLSEDPEDMNFSSDKGSAANKGYLVGGWRRRGPGRPAAAEFRGVRVLEPRADHGCPGPGQCAFPGPRRPDRIPGDGGGQPGRGTFRQRRGRVPHQQARDAGTGDAEVRQRGRPPDFCVPWCTINPARRARPR